MKNKSQISIILCSIVAIYLAIVNANQEYNSSESAIGFVGGFQIALLTVIPFVILLIWVSFKRKETVGLWMFSISLIISLIGVLGYYMYYLSDASNPMSAGHFHVILYPMLHTVFTIMAILVVTVLGQLKKAVYKRFT